MLPSWDHATLRAWFEARPNQDIVETELLAAFFPGDWDHSMGLQLYQKHFLLYRRLWMFDDELRQSTGHRLWIRGIRCTLLAPPAAEGCPWLDPDTGRYCPRHLTEGEPCPEHGGAQPAQNGVKAYYYDAKNLDEMTEAKLEDLMEGFLRWMRNQGPRDKALKALGLRQESTPQEIRTRWRQLSLEHHPDRGGDLEAYKKISAAWAALKGSLE